MDRFSTAAVIDLAEVVDRDGLDVHTATLFELAQRASELGVSPVLLDVMLSHDEPYVARVRAFTLLSAAVANRAVRSELAARRARTAVAV